MSFGKCKSNNFFLLLKLKFGPKIKFSWVQRFTNDKKKKQSKYKFKSLELRVHISCSMNWVIKMYLIFLLHDLCSQVLIWVTQWSWFPSFLTQIFLRVYGLWGHGFAMRERGRRNRGRRGRGELRIEEEKSKGEEYSI